ncbi:MAG: sporulation integral membrane protein YtvI [Oscillospiraceae bacterium]
MDREKQIDFLLGLLTCGASVLLLWLGLRYFLPWTLPFLIALALAAVMEPVIRWCRVRLRFQRSFSAAVMTLLLVSLLTLGLSWGLSRLLREAYAFLEQLPALLENLPLLVERLQRKAARFCAACPRELQLWLEAMTDSWAQQAAATAATLSSRLLGELTAFAGTLPHVGLFLITTALAIFYTAGHYPDIRAFLIRQLPRRFHRSARELRRNVFTTLGKWLKAESLLLLLTFLQVLGGLVILRVDYALLLALAIALVDALPILGVGTVLVPWALLCLLAENVPRGLGLLALYAIILLVHSIMEPRLMAAQVGLHPIAALFAMYLGFSILGIWGMLLFPLLLLLGKQLYDDFQTGR